MLKFCGLFTHRQMQLCIVAAPSPVFHPRLQFAG